MNGQVHISNCGSLMGYTFVQYFLKILKSKPLNSQICASQQNAFLTEQFENN